VTGVQTCALPISIGLPIIEEIRETVTTFSSASIQCSSPGHCLQIHVQHIPAALLGGETVSKLIASSTQLSSDLAIGGYPLWTVVVGIVALDLIVSFFISFNFDLLLKIPLIGPWFRWIMRNADKILRKRKWIEDLSSAGLLIFMYIPLQGSGAMTTSIIARILNYHPAQTVGLVTIGSILSCLTVALGITSIVQLWAINPVFAILEVLGIIVLIIIIAVLWSKFIRKMTDCAIRKKW